MKFTDDYINSILDPSKPRKFYRDEYDKIINEALLSRPIKKKYLYSECLEEHHIIPRCIKIDNNDNNLVLLTPLEHIICHYLLYLENKEDPSYKYAAWCMITARGKFTQDRELALEKIDIAHISRLREDYINSKNKPVVGFDDDINIVRIYLKQENCREDGFQPSGISNVISGNYKYHGGYLWMRLDEFDSKYPGKSDEYFNNSSNGVVPEIKNLNENYKEKRRANTVVKTKKIVCYDSNNEVIKVFNSLASVVELGFNYKHLSAVIKGDKGRKTSGGYYWKDLKNFKLLFPENLQKYYDNLKIGIEPTINLPQVKEISIVCCNKDNKVIKIYDNKSELFNDGYSIECVLKTISGKYSKIGNTYRDLNWYKLDDYRKKFGK